MRKTIVIYGLALAALTFLLKAVEYKYLIHDMRMEVYIGIIAVLFTAVGIWVATKIIRRKTDTVIKEVVVTVPAQEYVQNDALIEKLGISSREYDVLEQMSQGLSNQEIADKLFISLNTVKTHAANLYVKLDVKRRTQAVQKAKELHIIP
ncbi:MAG: LuxR C-terminal-related transcriptional regulator [Flavipsychrobacter sp.]